MKQSNFDIFLDVVRNSFLGKSFEYDGKTYKLEPTIMAPYDFLRKIEEPSSEYERLLFELKKDFKENAKTEMYRRKTGWIAKGISKEKSRR